MSPARFHCAMPLKMEILVVRTRLTGERWVSSPATTGGASTAVLLRYSQVVQLLEEYEEQEQQRSAKTYKEMRCSL